MNTGNPAARLLLAPVAAMLRPRVIPPIPRRLSGILIVRQHDQLGDMLCVIPTLKTLRRAYPKTAITLVASPLNFEIMKNHPALSRVLLFDKKAVTSTPAGLRNFLRALRREHYDAAIVPSTVSVSLTSGIIARLSGAPVRIGPGRLEGRDNPSKFLFTHPVDLDWSSSPARHQAARNADILGPLGLQADDLSTDLGLTPDELEHGRLLVEPLRKKFHRLVGIHPGAAKQGNRWPVESFVRLAESMYAGFGNGLVVTIGTKDAGVYDSLRQRLKVPHHFIRGESIRTVASVIAALDLFVSNDTGPLHIAGALPVPVLGLFGPTDPVEWAPIGNNNHYLCAADRLMSSIGPGEVFGLCEVILAGFKRETPRFD